MEKHILFPLALAALVSGLAFAQRIGDTVQSVNGNDVLLRKVVQAAPLPDREYLNTHGSVSGNRPGPKGIRISGNGGVLTDVSDGNQGSIKYKRAVDMGLLKLGDPIIRNIRSTGGNEYSCEMLWINGTGQRNRDAGQTNPFTPTGTEWRAAKLTTGTYLNNPRNPPGFTVEGWNAAGSLYQLQR